MHATAKVSRCLVLAARAITRACLRNQRHGPGPARTTAQTGWPRSTGARREIRLVRPRHRNPAFPCPFTQITRWRPPAQRFQQPASQAFIHDPPPPAHHCGASALSAGGRQPCPGQGIPAAHPELVQPAGASTDPHKAFDRLSGAMAGLRQIISGASASVARLGCWWRQDATARPRGPSGGPARSPTRRPRRGRPAGRQPARARSRRLWPGRAPC
jgi:hypothetical protein